MCSGDLGIFGGMKRTLELPELLSERLKGVAEKRGVSMDALIIELLEENCPGGVTLVKIESKKKKKGGRKKKVKVKTGPVTIEDRRPSFAGVEGRPGVYFNGECYRNSGTPVKFSYSIEDM